MTNQCVYTRTQAESAYATGDKQNNGVVTLIPLGTHCFISLFGGFVMLLFMPVQEWGKT
jgi:hypothetical protein